METKLQRLVYTGGTFDIPHAGHVHFLRQCKQLGRVVVALNTDDFIERYKGARPVFSYEERRKILLSLEYVDEVIPNVNGEDSKPAIESISPDILAIGTDWAKKDYYKQMNFTQEWLDEKGIVLAYLPYYELISTSEIKRRCASQL